MSDADRSPRGRRGSLLRRVAIRTVLVVLMVEASSWGAWLVLQRETFSWARVHAEQRSIATSEGVEPSARDAEPEPDEPRELHEGFTQDVLLRLRNQVLHPYVGFVFDPSANESDPTLYETIGRRVVTDVGFIGRPGWFEEPGDGRVVVGVTGGSVAFFFTIAGREVLRELLADAPGFQGKEIVFATMALPGFKQPQQLFALSYLLTLGARFDWVINLDGFNEVTLPVIENVPKGVAPSFPRSWYWRVQDAPDEALRSLMGEVAYLERVRRERAQSASDSPFAFSVTQNLVWKLRDQGLARDIAAVEAVLVDYRPDELPFVARGPATDFASDDALYAHLADVWARSSRQMHALCASNGIRYVHFLQPNQYVPGSKPLGPAERARAFADESPFKAPVEAGYPHLVSAGAELARDGVPFFDLTGLFAGNEAWLYDDRCCHLNAAGNALLAARIAMELR